MRCALWPEQVGGEHGAEIAAYFAGRWHEPQAVLVAEESGALVGLAELSIRSYAEGCRTNRVAYLEGWFVEPAARRRGVGRALVEAAEDWGRARGCKEFGSDTQADNDGSAAAHRALGFEEVCVVRAFGKDL
jgi:aminoglycoside 6'-N-acetyltransferase I